MRPGQSDIWLIRQTLLCWTALARADGQSAVRLVARDQPEDEDGVQVLAVAVDDADAASAGLLG